MFDFMKSLVRGLHIIIGITAPTPEQEGTFVFVWLGVLVATVSFMFGLVFLFLHFLY